MGMEVTTLKVRLCRRGEEYLGVEMSDCDNGAEGDVGEGIIASLVVETLLELLVRLKVYDAIPRCS